MSILLPGANLLDCLHEPSPHSAYTTGTAHTPDGREICWECADDEIRTSVDSVAPGEKVGGLYLTGKPTDLWKHLTSWSGGEILTITSIWGSRISPSCPDGLRFWAKSPRTDAMFYGSAVEFGMYANVTRSKTA